MVGDRRNTLKDYAKNKIGVGKVGKPVGDVTSLLSSPLAAVFGSLRE